jgi:AcrR family transcriptional regulator
MEPLSAHSAREWILVGMAESCAARGFERTGVADVCDAAGVERDAFDSLFEDREDCLAATVAVALDEARERLAASYVPAKPWAAAVRDGAEALLGLLAERPALARTVLIEAPAAGGRAAELYAEGRATARSFLERGREESAAASEVPAVAARAALAGAETLIVGEIFADRTRQLRERTRDVAYMLTVPYLGQSAALREAGRKGAFRHLRAVA